MSSSALDTTPIILIGHPFAPIGMGEQLRSHIAAMNTLGLHHRVLDVFRHSARTDDAHAAVVADREQRDLPGGIRIFHVNGDEVERVLATLSTRAGNFEDGYNVIVPAWELPTYPDPWAKSLARFDEIWALSGFVQDSLAAAGLASHLIGQSVEPAPGPRLPRRWFAIRESAFVLLNFLDLTSYATRKNPQAALDLFARLRAARPTLDLQLVLKVKNGEAAAQDWASSLPRDPFIRVLTEPLDSLGVRSLISACDCFVSLHRSEGFGRGLGEAMALGRLALGTAWSGNLDFMTEDNAVLVPWHRVPVRRGEYPHARGQYWAEPDVPVAAERLVPLLDNPELLAGIADRGRRSVLRSHGNRAVGLRILDRLEDIAGLLGNRAGRAMPRAASVRC